jgi:hypothetical protein
MGGTKGSCRAVMVSPWFRPYVTAGKSESNKHVSIDRFSQCCPAILVLFIKRIGKCEKYPTGKRKRLLVLFSRANENRQP